MTLHVLATFVARPDTIDQVRHLLISLVEPIRKDPGCARCHLVSNGADVAEMVFVEEWFGHQELDRHLGDPLIAGVVERVVPLLARPLTLHRYDVLE
ncbi:hypothetical protein GCM10027082_06400 [Comamonas humi]